MPSPNENLTSTFPATYTQYDYSTGRWTAPVQYATGTSLVRYRNTVSVKTPNWRFLKGAKPINKYDFSQNVVSDPRYSFDLEITRASDGHRFRNSYIGNNGTNGGDLSGGDGSADDPYQRAVNKLLANISLAKASTMVSLAEADKTAASVAAAATKIARSLKALKQARFADFAKELGFARGVYDFTKQKRRIHGIRLTDQTHADIWSMQSRKFYRGYHRARTEGNVTQWMADTWLEYSYGWKPLLNDVYDHAEALANCIEKNHSVVRFVKGRAYTSATFRRATDSPTSVWATRRFTLDQRWAEVGVFYRIPDSGALDYANVFGLNNPLNVAWELVPFSFVADWFIPIGNALENLTAVNGLQFSSGYVSTRDKKEIVEEYSSNGRTILSGGYYQSVSGGGKSQRTVVEIHRRVLSSFPPVPFPTFKDPRSIAHGLSAVALLKSLFLNGEGATIPKRLR